MTLAKRATSVSETASEPLSRPLAKSAAATSAATPASARRPESTVAAATRTPAALQARVRSPRSRHERAAAARRDDLEAPLERVDERLVDALLDLPGALHGAPTDRRETRSAAAAATSQDRRHRDEPGRLEAGDDDGEDRAGHHVAQAVRERLREHHGRQVDGVRHLEPEPWSARTSARRTSPSSTLAAVRSKSSASLRARKTRWTRLADGEDARRRGP